MIDYKLALPNDFDDYAWEVESKGWFEATAEFDNKRFTITFYDQARLSQVIADELESVPAFYESNLFVLKSVDRNNMERAIDYIAKSETYKTMFSN